MTTARFTDIRLITDNVEAWQAKRALIAQARRRLDLAYFIVDDDATSCALLLDLVTAAARGVKVRLLVDYFMTCRQAPALRALAGVRGIVVRRYRPPTAAWRAALQAAGINPSEFVAGLTLPDGARLKAALKGNTVFPPAMLSAIDALQMQAGENRLAFALRVLATLSDRRMVPDLASASLTSISGFASQFLASLAQPNAAGWTQLQAKLGLLPAVVQGLDEFLHRTHHKLLMADQRCFIMGGRNLADAYQRNGLPPGQSAFQDTDIQACDGLAADSEHVAGFRALWCSALSISIRQADVHDSRPALALQALQAKAGELAERPPAARPNATCRLPDMAACIVNNLPSGKGDPSITHIYVDRIKRQADRGTGVIDIVNAYVCLAGNAADSAPLLALSQSLLDAAAAGVTVNIRTNSITSTDLPAVNRVAYQHLSKLIEVGVNVFELDEGQGSLHTKAAAIGDDCLIIGSYNLDPRSELYDTNNLIVLEDKQGIATAAFRQHRVAGLAWTRLTAQRAQALAAEHALSAAGWALFKRLL